MEKQELIDAVLRETRSKKRVSTKQSFKSRNNNSNGDSSLSAAEASLSSPHKSHGSRRRRRSDGSKEKDHSKSGESEEGGEGADQNEKEKEKEKSLPVDLVPAPSVGVPTPVVSRETTTEGSSASNLAILDSSASGSHSRQESSATSFPTSSEFFSSDMASSSSASMHASENPSNLPEPAVKETSADGDGNGNDEGAGGAKSGDKDGGNDSGDVGGGGGSRLKSKLEKGRRVNRQTKLRPRKQPKTVYPSYKAVDNSSEESSSEDDGEYAGGGDNADDEDVDYTYVETIGRGTFGEIWLCVHELSQRKYVLKLIDLHALQNSGNSNDRKAQLQELVLLKQLTHANICPYRESFVHAGNLTIVMRFCHGGDLRRKIHDMRDSGDFFPERQILDWFLQLARAVNYCHEANVMHRDIKSLNVFLTESGRLVLGDFGIAAILDTPDAKVTTVVGTPLNLSPELCRKLPYGLNSDVWAMGCVLYEMCALVAPFQGDSVWRIVHSIVMQEPVDIPMRYSQNLSEIVMWLLTKDQEQRPSSQDVLNHPFLVAHAHSMPEYTYEVSDDDDDFAESDDSSDYTYTESDASSSETDDDIGTDGAYHQPYSPRAEKGGSLSD
jgi:serine/threonine protein kinase